MSHDSHGLFAHLDSRLEQFVDQVARQIRNETGGYSLMNVDEHANDLFVQIRAALDGLRAGRLPNDLDIALATTVGQRRAENGVPLTDVIDAYHIAYREMWSALMTSAGEAGHGAVEALASDAEALWRWCHRLTAAVAEAHASRSHVLQTAEASLRRHLLDTLTDPELHADREDTARRLGLDPDSWITVAATDRLDEGGLSRVVRSIHQITGAVAVGCHDGRLAYVVANTSDDQLEDAFRGTDPTIWAGIGVTRPGIALASLSLADAIDALTHARTARAVVRFADDWLACSMRAMVDRLGPLLAPAVEAAHNHQDWAETVTAFADQGFSASATSRRMHVHANSVRYRLDRWHEATGWDPRTFTGLATSVLAIQIARQSGSSRSPVGSEVTVTP